MTQTDRIEKMLLDAGAAHRKHEEKLEYIEGLISLVLEELAEMAKAL